MHEDSHRKPSDELLDEDMETLDDEEDSEAGPENSSPFPGPHSGTLSSVGDSERLPVVETGLSIDPEDLGIQFLRDATDQDNFESYVAIEEVEPGLFLSQIDSDEVDSDEVDSDQLDSETTLEAAPESGIGRRRDAPEGEPQSLFDRPTGSDY